MTSRVQRLASPWRAYKNKSRVGSCAVRVALRRAPGATLIFAAAFCLPAAANAVGAAGGQTQPKEAQSPAQEQQAQADIAPKSKDSDEAPHSSGGLVRYDKPVFHNGHRVLWHGAWRSGGARSRAAVAPPAAPAQAAPPSNARDILVLADSADACATRMAAEFASAMQSVGLHVKAVPGKTSPAALDKAITGDTADLAIAPMDALGNSTGNPGDKDAGRRGHVPYLARLANEPIAVIAPRALTDLHQLKGRKVNVAAADGATAATAAIVFSRLDIAPTMNNEPLPEALAHLTHGDIDAVFVVGSGDSKALADFGKNGRFHVLAIPYAPALQTLYAPMRLTAHDQANLIGADERVDTIGVPTALLAIDAAPDSPRASRIAPVVEHLFAQFDQSVGALPESKWKDVNLAARIPGWPRFGASQAWLEQNKGASSAALDAFRGVAETAARANEGPGGADSDRLYDSLMQLNRTAQ